MSDESWYIAKTQDDRVIATLQARVKEMDKRIAELEAENARLQHELQLAIAHDRQPYPTAEAYELACKAREKFRQRVEELESMLATKDEALKGVIAVADRKTKEFYAAHSALALTPASFRARREAEMKVIEMARWEIKNTDGLTYLDSALDELDALNDLIHALDCLLLVQDKNTYRE